MRRGLAGIVGGAARAGRLWRRRGSSGAKEEGGVTKVRVGMLPISNAAPLYLGIKKGFFKEEGLEVEPVDRPERQRDRDRHGLRLDSSSRFLGYVPLMSARSQGLPVKVVANADNGAETEDKEWTLISPRRAARSRSPPDLAGKTIAVNALKGVGEVVIKAALEKRGVDPNSIKLLEVPFPEMPAALDKGRVDAIWAPEPFLTSVLGEGGQDVEAPLTTLGKKYPNGNYATTEKQIAREQGRRGGVRARDQQVAWSTRPRIPTRRGRRSRRSRRSRPRSRRRSACRCGRGRSNAKLAEAARLRGQVQGDREAAEARRRDLGGGRS